MEFHKNGCYHSLFGSMCRKQEEHNSLLGSFFRPVKQVVDCCCAAILAVLNSPAVGFTLLFHVIRKETGLHLYCDEARFDQLSFFALFFHFLTYCSFRPVDSSLLLTVYSECVGKVFLNHCYFAPQSPVWELLGTWMG